MDNALRSPHNFRTRYDTRRPSQASSAVTFPSVGVAEAGPQPDPHEPYYDLIASEGFDKVLRTVFIPYVQNIRQQLLRRPNIEEKDRQKLVGSLLSIEYLLTQIYAKANEPIPDWVSAQFK